ncbi:cbb3-type cytochrome c oxidase subunit 3 [Steroidobacter sp.]|uniref:cbb3-type cytochrome oxidase subunit 3 n=1 Tax=Steroidobacter sp. TaxID=1978227 RepID=UPI0032C21BA8
MSSGWGHFSGIVTLLLMAIFIGIWFWAWRPRHRHVFHDLARIPLADADPPAGTKGHTR